MRNSKELFFGAVAILQKTQFISEDARVSEWLSFIMLLAFKQSLYFLTKYIDG